MENVKPLRQLGVHKISIVEVLKKEPSNYKGKNYPAKIVVVCEDFEGRRIDANFKLPFTDEKHKWDKSRFEGLLKLAKVARASELKGKGAMIFVEPREWDNKVFWDVKGFYDEKYTKSAEAVLDSALDGVDSLTAPAKTGSDNINW